MYADQPIISSNFPRKLHQQLARNPLRPCSCERLRYVLGRSESLQ